MTQLLLKLIVLQMRTTKIQLISYVFHVDTVSLDMFVNIYAQVIFITWNLSGLHIAPTVNLRSSPRRAILPRIKNGWLYGTVLWNLKYRSASKDALRQQRSNKKCAE